MVETITDEQLIHSYQKGEADAFEALYARYKNAIYHYFFRQVHSDGIADELHQDVWLNIIKSSSGFKRQSSFKTWLYKIAHNRLIDHYRQSSRQPLYLVQPAAQAESLTEETTETGQQIQTSDKPSNEPDEALQEQQISHALLKGISALPEEQKEVFLLHEKSGLTLQEIALISGSSLESTKSRLRYAVKKLRQHMKNLL
ncbi:MAG: sigma-70 family RNA polymerase sigma factor [Gammaproteobacteria bacterium]|nr:sigma-70 family RNA polymerase sigma factor [Gammaproteobacteria bacterium]